MLFRFNLFSFSSFVQHAAGNMVFQFIFNLFALFYWYFPLVFRTIKRPVPLEHCLFYSGELYKVCESEIFMPLGFKAAKDAFKRKNTTASNTGSHAGPSTSHDGARSHKRENSGRGKQNKHSGSQSIGGFYGGGGGHQSTGNGLNNWGLRRSDASLWLSLINKLSKKSLLPVCLNIIPEDSLVFNCMQR